MATSTTPFQLFEQGFALAEFGDYAPEDRDFATVTELPGGVVVTLSIEVDTVIQVTQHGTLVFHAVENYDRAFEVMTFEQGDWIDEISSAYEELIR